jgi:ribosomal protein S18 acetylase RimI-like enzyme
MEVLLATELHVPEIVDVWKEFMDFLQETHPFFIRSEDGHLKFGEHLKEWIKSDDYQVLVALDSGKVVAYSIAKICKLPPLFEHVTYGFIADLAVKSEFHRKGIGEQILEKILGWFKHHQIDRIELMVLAKNEIGLSFWKKHEFEVFAHRMFLTK